VRELFDETILDGRSFDELREALDFVLERIGKIEEELSDGEDDLRLDGLYTVTDIIIKRMDSLVRECARESPGNFVQWGEVMRDYEVHYDKYTDAILEDDILLDFESPENS
jgi:hypothetical protein